MKHLKVKVQVTPEQSEKIQKGIFKKEVAGRAETPT